MIDLHTHSTASDGALKPAALVEAASKKGIGVLALTDHDTLDGVPAAQKAAADFNIRLIPGVELEIEWTRGEFHLLGLGLYRPSPKLDALLEKFSKLRIERNLQLLEKMNRLLGLSASYADIEALGGESSKSIGRPHFASYMIRRQKVKNLEEAFGKYLGVGRPLYVKKEGVPFDEAVGAIHEAGAIAVVAHPSTLYLTMTKLEKTLRLLKERELDGIEAWHPNTGVEKCKKYEALAKSLGLLVTAGSDFHGEGLKNRKLGRTAGGFPIDDSSLPETLRE